MRTILQRLLAFAFVLSAVPSAFAQLESYNFESDPGIRSAPTIIVAPHLRISGGEIVPGLTSTGIVNYPGMTTKVYASIGCPTGCAPCPSCGDIVLTFDEPADYPEFTLSRSNAQTDVTFTFTDDLGHSETDGVGCSNCTYTNPALFVWSYKGIRNLTIHANLSNGAVRSFAIDDLEYYVSPNLALVARLGDDPDAAGAPAPVEVRGNMSVNVPLGGAFSIRLKVQAADGSFVDAPIGNFGLLYPQVDVLPPETLFPGIPIFLYLYPPNPATGLFQSVHYGSVQLDLVPADPSLDSVSVTINSIGPASLGPDSPTVYDQYFIGQGALQGIPPQYLKALAFHESGLQHGDTLWRYAPNADRLSVLPNRTAAIYQDYRLATPNADGALSAGTLLCPGSLGTNCAFSDANDLSAPATLPYRRNGNYAYIPGDRTDGYVTIREICDGDGQNGTMWQHGGDNNPQCPPYTTLSTGPVSKPRISAPYDPWNSIANPDMASSYGVMQSTWFSVLSEGVFQGASGRFNPSLLFDTPENIARGTASVVTGPAEYRYKFNYFNKPTRPAVYVSPAYFDDDHHTAISQYNSAARGDDGSAYADAIMATVPNFLPTLPSNIHILSDGCTAVPQISADATSKTIVAGGNVLVTAGISGATRYQWYAGAVNDTSNPIPQGDSDSIQVSPSATTSYWVSASNDCGTAAQSTTITVVTDCTPPNITNITPNTVSSALAPVTLSVTATGSPTYQWYQVPAGGQPAAIDDATGASVTVAPSADTQYFVLATNSCFTVTSSLIHVRMTACGMPSIAAQPVDVTVAAGLPGTLSLTPSSDTPYQVTWFRAEGAFVGSGNSIVVTPPSTSTYYAKVENDCDSVRSANVSVIVVPPCSPPVIVMQPVGSTIAAGQTATLSLNASGGQPLTVQWFTALGAPAGTGATITVSPTETTDYYATVSNGCGSVNTQTVTVQLITCSAPTILVQPAPQLVLYGQTAMLQVTAVGDPSPSTEWFTSDGGSIGTGISIWTAPVQTTTYYAVVTNQCGSVRTSDVVVQVCRPPAITTNPANTTITVGQSTNLSVVATSDTQFTYQWYQGVAGDTSTPIAGATADHVTVSPAQTTSYWVLLTNDFCETQSTAASVTVCYPPSAISLSGGGEIVRGQSMTLFASSTGTGIAYQWYLGSASDTSTPIYNGAQSITVTPQSPTNYWVRVTGACGSRDSATVSVSVCDVPTITSQPQGLSVFFGSTATLSVTATVTTATPLTYQWYVGDSGTTSSPISGATSSSYTTPPLTTDTSYWVAVSSDICGPTLSDAAIVSICLLPPTMPAAPDQTIRLGQTAHVELAPFTPPTGNTFFWYQGASGDTSHPLGDFTGDWGPYDYIDVSPAVTTQYWAQIKNGTCVANTGTTTINVCIPTITQQPTGLMINGGQSTTLTVVANTPGLTYQWYTGASGNTSSPISGATNASYIASPTVTTSYWVRVTGLCAQSADSNTATITICQPPSAISLSGGGEIVRGQTMTLFASSTGTGITYQWYQGSASDTSTPIYSGAQSITVNPQSLTNYWVRVSGTCGSRDSATVTVNVCAAPTITSQPQGVSVFSGGTTTLSVSASVATATPLTYQWYIGASGTTSSPISGATSSSYTTPALNTDTSYWVAVSSDICGPALSDAAIVSICPLPPTMTGAPSQSISFGQTAHLVIPPFSPSTGDTFFWYQGAAGDTSHPLGDYSGDWGPYNYLDVSPAVTTQYWAQIKNGTCIASTGTTTVSVCIPTITQQPASLMINSGQTTTLTVAANTAGLTYHWYQGASGNTSVPVGTNSPTFTTPALTATTSYWVLVTGTCGQSVSSNTATVTICQTPAITVQPAGTSLVRGYSTTLGVSATGTSLSYQWYLGTSGNTGSPLAGNSNSYTVTNPQNPVDYWVKVSGTCGTPVNSATAHISVCTTPTINTQPQSSYTFSGGSATLSVSASEATGETLHYQWHKGTTSPVNVGTDSPTYNTGALSAVTSYYVTVTAGTAGLCSVDSAAATVSICTYPQTVTGAPNANTSPGQSVRLTIASNPGVTSYLWYRGVSGDTSNPMGGWQAANYVDVAPTTTTSYWAQWQADSGSCISNTTTTTVSVCIPVITTQPANVTIASGSTTLSVVSNLPGSTYQWYVGASGTTTSPISGATSASVTVSPGTTTSYWCRVSGSCATANSNTATVTICSPPAITHQPTNSVAQSGQLNVLTVTATGTNLTYQWYMGASGDTSNPMSGRTASTLQNNLTSSVQYWVKVSGTCGSVNSSAAWMSVPPGILSQPQQTTYVAQGSKGNLFVNAVGTGLHYQWWGDSGPVAGAPDSPNFISPDVNATADYYCIITSSGGAQTTSWTATFYLCTGVPINSTTVTNAGGNCRNLISNVAGSYNNMTWYQGQRGDTSVQVGTNYYLSVCPSTSTTYWFRVYNTDSSQGVSCYTDSAATTVP
jgi:hypothetical protein